MANGKFLVGKPAGGITTVTMTDGASNTNLVLPESGTVATQAYADGKTTLAQVQAEIRTGSNLITSPTGVIGYGTGTVTQLTSKSTAVTLNKPCGQITMHNAALASGASINFILNNDLVGLQDIVVVNTQAFVNYNCEVYYKTAGIVGIRVTNITGANLSEVVRLNFSIIKGAIS